MRISKFRGESYELCRRRKGTIMQHQHPHELSPPDCFRQEEAERFLDFENQKLEAVNYYLWRTNAEYGTRSAESGFLYALEMQFGHGEMLLLSSGESSESITIITAETLVETARKLQELHSETLMQRFSANAQPLWQGAVGAVLQGIRLSKHEDGLYRNDALLLDFEEKKIVVQLGKKAGLELGEY